MTRCLVTGASGFVGRQLIRALAEDGSEVSVLGRRPLEGWRTLVGDLTSVDFDLGGEGYCQVYHVAGLAHFGPQSASESERFFDVNVGGTYNLLRALERQDALPESVVFASSVAVYGMESGELLDEQTPRRAIDAYGASKRMAEDLLLEWGARFGVRVALARLPLIVGKDAPGNLGAIVRALRAGWYLGLGSGSARRSVVLVADAAQALRDLAKVGGVFNLTDGCHPSVAELEAALARALGRRAPPRLPLWAATLGARVGDGVECIMRRRLPLNGTTLARLTATLTFSDQRARDRFSWNPAPVVERIPEVFA